VYKLDSSTKVGQSQKLRSPWTGPYLVISCSPPLYTIKDRKRQCIIHHDKLKLCLDWDIPVWLRRMRNQYFHTDDSLCSQELKDGNNSQSTDAEVSNDDQASKEDTIVVHGTTRAGRSIRLPSKYHDFQLWILIEIMYIMYIEVNLCVGTSCLSHLCFHFTHFIS
jgi:hypothetical protein